jgi:hypothetical protein
VSIGSLDDAKIHIIDAKTREPIRNVRHIVGVYEWGEESIYWFYWGHESSTTDGILHWKKPQLTPVYSSYDDSASITQTKFIAEGYPTKVSTTIDWNPETQRYEVAIEPAEPTRFKVLLPDGTPAQKTEIAVVTSGDWTADGGGRIPQSARRFQTDDAGNVSLFCEPRDSLAAMNDKGMMLCEVAKMGEQKELRFVSWGRIEGSVKDGQKPASGGKVRLNIERDSGIRGRFFQSATVDAEGKFVLEKVFPGYSYDVQWTRKEGIIAGEKTVSVKPWPGQTTVAAIGGRGIPVKGRIVFPDASLRPTGYQSPIRLVPVSLLVDPDKRQAEERERRSDGGVEWFDRTTGDFTFPDIVPGAYRVYVTIGGYRTASNTVVQIPKPDKGKETETHDLGVIEFRLMNR